MTLGEMRRQMIRRMVPEELIPQNIIEYLMDNEAEPPELDAFTFLTRLRDLGIGSADFIHLLDGCGAPRAAVDRIRANPAMSLQALIVTLESAGMNSEDYSRILYTARQIWEQTLTLRLEKSELISRGGFPDEAAPEEEFEKFGEPEFTDIFDKVADEMSGSVGAPAAPPVRISAENAARLHLDIPPAPRSHIAETKPEPPLIRETPAPSLGGFPEELITRELPRTPEPPAPPVTNGEFTESFNKIASSVPGYIQPDTGVPGIPEMPPVFGIPEQTYTNTPEPSVQKPAHSIFEDSIPTSLDDMSHGAIIPETPSYEPPITRGYTNSAENFPYGEHPGYRQYTEAPVTEMPVSEEPMSEMSAPEEQAPEIFALEEPTPEMFAPEEPTPEMFTPEEPVPESAEYSSREETNLYGDTRTFPRSKVSPESGTTREITVFGAAERSEKRTERSPEESREKAYKETEGLYGQEPDGSADSVSAEPTNPAQPSAYELEEIFEEPMEETVGNEPESLPEEDSVGETASQTETVSQTETASQTEGVSDETNTIIQIDAEMLKEKLSQLTHEEVDLKIGGGNDDDSGEQTYSRHMGAVIASGVGAALLIGFSAVSDMYLSKPPEKEMGYAEDASEIFASIYTAHSAKTPGGAAADSAQLNNSEIFGDLLVSGDGLGVYSDGADYYSITSEAVKVSAFNAGTFTPLGEWSPPEDTQFVDAFEDNGSPVVVFGGDDECGFMKIQRGEVVFTAHQDGKLTDISRDGGELTLCSVYTPAFYRTFSADDEEVYLPKLGTDTPGTVSPRDVVVSGTLGYSYGVLANYSLENGAVLSSKAVIGDPVTASSDGRFAMTGESEGMLISLTDAVASVKTGSISAAAFFENGCATYENGIVVIRDKDFNITSEISAFPEAPDSLCFSGSVLLLKKDGEMIYAADCSDLAHPPKVMEPRPVRGRVLGSEAVAFETNDKGLVITRYTLENGIAQPLASYSKALKAAEIETLEPGSSNTVILGDGYSGAAYKYFNGTSIISDYAVFGAREKTASLFDNKAGFIYAFEKDGKIYAASSEGAQIIER